jgi:hypothetical protein
VELEAREEFTLEDEGHRDGLGDLDAAAPGLRIGTNPVPGLSMPSTKLRMRSLAVTRAIAGKYPPEPDHEEPWKQRRPDTRN